MTTTPTYPAACEAALSALALGRARELAERIANSPNDYAPASAGWVWWQDVAEELAEVLTDLDQRLSAGAPLPSAWAVSPADLEPTDA